MKRARENNYAFIDSQNLNLSIRALGWRLDFKRFLIYLKEKYGVSRAYLFIGYLESNESFYIKLKDYGYTMIFKPTLEYKKGKVKGNCDAELVLQAMIDFKNYSRAVIVTGDGDFHCLVKYLIEQRKLKKLLIPNQKRYSALLKSFPSEYLGFVSDLKEKLSYKMKRTPYGQNRKGRFSS